LEDDLVRRRGIIQTLALEAKKRDAIGNSQAKVPSCGEQDEREGGGDQATRPPARA
jgi:hypothetical protein